MNSAPKNRYQLGIKCKKWMKLWLSDLQTRIKAIILSKNYRRGNNGPIWLWINLCPCATKANNASDDLDDKTQRQLCKRLAGLFIPFSWSCLVWKRVSLWLWSLGGSQQPFSSVLGHFRHGDEQTNKRTNEQPGEPSASLLLTSVKRQSFAKFSSSCKNQIPNWKSKSNFQQI